MKTLTPEKMAELALCMKSGLDNLDSGIGCYAVSPQNYDEFAMFFDKVCEDYHKGGGKVHTTNWSLDGVEGLPDDKQLDLQKFGLTEPLSMRVRVGRNLTSFPLPGLMVTTCTCTTLPLKPVKVTTRHDTTRHDTTRHDTNQPNSTPRTISDQGGPHQLREDHAQGVCRADCGRDVWRPGI